MDQLSRAWESLTQILQSSSLFYQPTSDPYSGSSTPPLITAVLRQNINAVQVVLELDVDINLKDDLGYNALHYAAMSGAEEIVLLLLAKGATIGMRTSGSGLTALALAVASEHKVVGKILMDRGERTGPQALSRSGMVIYNSWLAEFVSSLHLEMSLVERLLI